MAFTIAIWTAVLIGLYLNYLIGKLDKSDVR